ncbi:MAG: CinA family protein [Ruminococcaceae bacterium]|nr:CinA family protein [Oscillospiraceae bacterium]
MNDYEKINSEIKQLARHIVKTCGERGIKIATAESCTGGLVCAAVTAVSGSSSVIELGVCSYSNRIKQLVLGVSEGTLQQYSEYSIQCAEEMAKGALDLSGAALAVSTTGVAGPTGGTDEHPVGEVCIAVRSKERVHSKRYVFEVKSGSDYDERDYIRAQAVRKALMLLELMIMTE